MKNKIDKSFYLNMDFTQSVCLRPKDQKWVRSPADGVWRIHLERVAKESGHVTSFVKFEQGSYFPQHTHLNGEEIYVMDGIFSDERGDYPAGTYIRNPPGSFHKPFTREGCKLFVKLDQFQDGDIKNIVILPKDQQWINGVKNLKVLPLHIHNTESISLVLLSKNKVLQANTDIGGEEIMVINGEFIDENGNYPAGTWLRNPHISKHLPSVEKETLIYLKVGHL